MKETQFTKEKEEVNKLTEKIRELNKQRNEFRKIIVEGIRKINLEKREIQKKIFELQKKLGLPISKPDKVKHIHKPPFHRAVPLPIRLDKPMLFKHPRNRPFGVKFGKVDFVNIPKTQKENEDIKNKTFDDWGRILIKKSQEIANDLAEKFKDIPFFNQLANTINTEVEKKEKKEGKGIYDFASGNRYVSEWRNGIKEGKGIWYNKDGDRYEGNYRNNNSEGKGSKPNPNRRIPY